METNRRPTYPLDTGRNRGGHAHAEPSACEAVLSEAQFLVARFGGNPRAALE
jgi:hypothetical protein